MHVYTVSGGCIIDMLAAMILENIISIFLFITFLHTRFKSQVLSEDTFSLVFITKEDVACMAEWLGQCWLKSHHAHRIFSIVINYS